MTVPSSVHAAMQQAVSDGVFPGAVLALFVQDRIQYTSAVGRLSLPAHSPSVQPSTVYDLASLTKPLVTVTAIALLMQDSGLRLEDPVESVLPELRGYPVGHRSIHDLLTHSSGLPGWRPLHERLAHRGLLPEQTPASAIRQAATTIIGEELLIYERGTRSLYSDLGFILLGYVVEHLTGSSLDRWFAQEITGPLGASPLLFRPTAADGPRGFDRNAIAPTEYDEREDRYLQGEAHDENARALGGVAGHAGLFGTAEAVLVLARAWLSAWRGEQSILAPAVARRFTARDGRVPNSSWALGWDTPSLPSSSGKYFSPESFGHLGYTGTSVWIDPVRGIAVVLLSNRVHPTRKNEKIRDFRPRIHDLVVKEASVD